MPWNESHKQASRQRILAAAADLFTRKGFHQVGIDEVMELAGMTRGAFYAHFSSKIELYEEAIIAAAMGASAHFGREGANLEQLVDAYLSREHLNSPDVRCPMACLVSDVAHDDARVKHIYTRLFNGFSKQLCAESEASAKAPADVHLLRAILLIGGMAVARSLTDSELADRVLGVARQAAKNLNSTAR